MKRPNRQDASKGATFSFAGRLPKVARGQEKAETWRMPTYVIRDQGMAETKKVIRTARSTVDVIAAALLEREMLSGDEVREVVRGVAK